MAENQLTTGSKEREVGIVNLENEPEFVYTIAKIKALGDLLTALPYKADPNLRPATLTTLGNLILDQAERLEELTGLQAD
jgi:ABC-type antimicrobial peptide transport system ATPase subunit